MRKKERPWIFPLGLAGIVLTLINISSCKKESALSPTTAVLTTAPLTDIKRTIASSGGDVTFDGGSTVTGRGVCWSIGTSPTTADSKTKDGNGGGPFTSQISGLTANTEYHVRAYANNSAGTAYGSEISFTTKELPIDFDGNVYPVVNVGTQEWMVENLKVTHYNEGTQIELVTDNTEWSNLTTAGFCWYDNDAPTNKHVYGAMYNWYAVNTGKLCPNGFHMPDDIEWTALTTYLGGESVAGGKLKEADSAHLWDINRATNGSGFTALPGGFRDFSGSFHNNTTFGYWWSSSENSIDFAWNRFLFFDAVVAYRTYYSKRGAYSVRCLSD